MIPSKEELNHALKMRHGEALHTRISTAVIAVCGLGGLGSNIAVSLARAGVGKLILIDFDQVDVSNLHRQQYKASQVGLDKTQALSQNLWEISPYIDLETHTVRIADEDDVRKLLSSADIICEAFDHAEAKSMLTNAVLELLPDKYLIAASGMAGLGSANAIQTRQITSRFYLCGDRLSDAHEGLWLMAPRVMLCAAHQAQMALRILAYEFEP